MPTAQKLESAANTVKSMVASEGVKAEAQDVSEQLETLRADMAQLMSSVAALGKAKSDEVASSVKAKSAEVASAVSETAESLRRRGESAYDQAAELTRSRPGEALAIAAGVGFLAGLLVRRG